MPLFLFQGEYSLAYSYHQTGTRSELVVSEHLVGLGFYVFSPVVHQQGPVDIVAVNDEGDVFLIDAKTDTKRLNRNAKTPSRIYRIKSDLQKKLGVIHAYVTKTGDVHFVPSLVLKDLTKKED